MNNRPERKNHRLRNFDYSSKGAYFITICANERFNIFGEIKDGKMSCTQIGIIATQEIENTNYKFEKQGIKITKHVIMPNHVHMIIEIIGYDLINKECKNRSISTVIRSYKAAVTKKSRETIDEKDFVLGKYLYKIWQGRYHDHIIRNQNSYEKIWNYIDGNVSMWKDDCYNDHAF